MKPLFYAPVHHTIQTLFQQLMLYNFNNLNSLLSFLMGGWRIFILAGHIERGSTIREERHHMNAERHSDLEQAKTQLELCKQQDQLLEQIETVLYEMKEIAQYATKSELSPIEINRLNDEIQVKQQAAHVLEVKLSQLRSPL